MTAVPAWHDSAACAGHSHPEWWDGRIDGETPEQRRRRHQAAAAVCRTCPVAAQCWADRARSHGVHAGWWNGQVIRIPGGPAPLRPCGTTAAYARHIRRGEKPCDACRAAMSARRKKQRDAARERRTA